MKETLSLEDHDDSMAAGAAIDTAAGMTNADLAVLVRSLIATLDDPAFALPDGKQTNILLVPGDVQVEGGRLAFAVVLARGDRATKLEELVREHLLEEGAGS
jgi:hypothetical protein